jgi:hypothetical protein
MNETSQQRNHWKLWAFLASLFGLLHLFKAATGEHEVIYRLLLGLGFVLTVPQTILRREFIAGVSPRSAKFYDWLAWGGVILAASGLVMDLFNL